MVSSMRYKDSGFPLGGLLVSRALSPYSLAGEMIVLSRFLTILPPATLAFATIGEGYRPACQRVEAAISNASEVYYPGE